MNAGQYEGLMTALGNLMKGIEAIRDRLPNPDAQSGLAEKAEPPICGDSYHRHTGPCEMYTRKSEHKSDDVATHLPCRWCRATIGHSIGCMAHGE